MIFFEPGFGALWNFGGVALLCSEALLGFNCVEEFCIFEFPEIMTRQILYIVLLSLGFSSCSEKKPKYMYYGLADALNEKKPENVLRLTFINSNLDSVPKEILKFTNLIDLDLSLNKLKSIPTWIIQFEKLQSLDASANMIDTLPLGLGKMKRLKSLNLGSNNLEKLPEDFAYLDSLTFLSLDLNKFKTVPKVIFSLINLENVHLYNNQISQVSDSISKLKYLYQLNIDNNCLTCQQFEHLKKLLPSCLMGNYNREMNYNCK